MSNSNLKCRSRQYVLWQRGLILVWICLLGLICTQAFGSVKVFVKQNKEDKSKSDVFIKDYSTGKATKFVTITDDNSRDYHPAEYSNGSLYIIRRTPGGDNAYEKTPDWTDELWKYDKSGKGTRLLTSKGLDFRVSEDGKLIAVITESGENNYQDNTLLLLKYDGSSIKTFRDDKLGLRGSFDFEKWAGRYLWMKDSEEIDLYGFIRIDTSSMTVKKYKISIFDQDYDLNTSSLLLAYDDYPVFLDTIGAEDFIKSKATVKLFVYDLVTHSKRLLSKSITKAFSPKWIDMKTLEYDNPRGKGRLTKRIR